MKTVDLGFEVGTGNRIEIPILNLAITGQTQQSGKTTTLEALVSRAGVPAIAFVTKRGESAFSAGNRLQPYFRDRADWQFVSSIIDATLQEKNKFLRSWIIKICRTTKTLADVQREVRKALKDARGISEGVYTQLDAYLDLIIPEIQRTPLSTGIVLRPGLNVMDVSGYSTPMQMLFVQSAIDWVNAHAHGVVTVVPEAWEFIPEGKSSPVKASAISLVRKGSGIGNHIWVDSQDMAGVDKTILRGCPVWLIGVQRESNEIKRNLSNIPAGIQRPKPEDIANLDRGQFYACWKDRAVKVYVQPAWMQEMDAREISIGRQTPPIQPKEESVSPQEAERLERENQVLRSEIAELKLQLKLKNEAGDSFTATSREPVKMAAINEDELFARLKERIMREAPMLLKLAASTPEMEVTVTRRTVEASGDTLRGRIAILLANGFFDNPRAGTAIEAELRRQGFACSRPNCYREADKLASDGFFTKEDGGYQAVPGMKVNIVEAA